LLILSAQCDDPCVMQCYTDSVLRRVGRVKADVFAVHEILSRLQPHHHHQLRV